MTGRLNPRWVLSTLRQRGLPVPDLKQLESALNVLQPDAAERMRRVVSDLTRGGEGPNDMEWIAQWARGLKSSVPPVEARPKKVLPEKPARPHVVAHPLEASHHVYGKTAAMCVEVRRVKDEPGERGSYTTVAFEFAPAAANPQREYSWDHKVVFRLGQRELPRVASLFAGYNHLVELEGHGPSHNKSLSIEDQGTHIFMKARQGRTSLAVQVTAADLLDVSARVIHAVTQNAPGLHDQPLLLLLRRTGQMDALALQQASEAKAA